MEWVEFLFQTDGGHFQWLGLSAAAAGLGLCVNAIDNRRKFKADLVSKSRIEWISETKHVLSDFLHWTSACSVQNVSSVGAELRYRLDETNKEYEENYTNEIHAYNDANERLQTARRYLLMTFSRSSDNMEILSKIDEIDELRSKFIKDVNDVTDLRVFNDNRQLYDYKLSELNKSIEDVVPLARDYFKDEWEKAKKGK